jgi:hypothetical protein
MDYYHFSVLLIVIGGLNTNLVTMGGNCLQVFMGNVDAAQFRSN